MSDISGAISEIPISAINTNARQRSDMGDITSLQLSIDRIGLQYPIIVQPLTNGTYDLVAGGRRLQAFKNLDRQTIPAVFKENLDEVSKLELELEENIQRKQLTHLEEAKAIFQIDQLKRKRYGSALPGRFSQGGWSQADTAKSLGISVGKVSQDISIAEAIEKHPELQKIPTRREVLREIRRIEEGTYSEKTPELEIKFKESFISEANPLSYLDKISPGTIDLAFLDYSPGEDAFHARLENYLKPTGMGYVFFEVQYYILVCKTLKDHGFRINDLMYIWHVRGKDDYIPFIWFSRFLQKPPANVNIHNSYSLDKDSKSLKARPYELLFHLVTLSSPKAGYVVDFHSMGPGLFRVGTDTGRNTLSLCPNEAVYNAVMESFHE